MASVQGAVLEWLKPQLQVKPLPGVDSIGLLVVDPPDQEGGSLTCSIEVSQASFDAQVSSYSALRVSTQMTINFTIEPGVARQQEKRDWLYRFFTDQIQGFTGVIPDGAPEAEQYSIQGILLTGYSQGLLEGTEVSAEQYGILVPNTTVLGRGIR